jgi:hypothetical protein
MGWLSDAVSVVGDAFGGGSSGGGSWLGLAGKAVDTGLGLWSNYETQKENEKAASRIVEANERNAAAVEAANLEAQERYEQLAADAAPGVTYLKKLAANDPYSLTPGQEQFLEQQRRETANALSRSGLRGSGRAVTTALREVDSNSRNNLIDSNLARSDRAASQLSGMSLPANSGAANYGVDAARYGTGAMSENAEVQGASELANDQLSSSGLADISGAVSALIKEGRKSRYFKTDNDKAEVI